MHILKRLREARGLLQKDVAAYLGVDRTTYVKYERGDSEPNFQILDKLASFFDVSVDKILAILITAYEKELNEEEVDYFSKYTIMELYKAASQFEESRTPEEMRLVQNFNKLYLNE